MTVDDHILNDPPGRGSQATPPRLRVGPDGSAVGHGRRRRPRLRKLRLLVVLVAFVLIAGVALVFGMLTSVASDLPQLSNQVQFNSNVDSVLYDDTGKAIGVLAPPNNPVRDRWNQISPNMVHAIVAVEDKRFWTDTGIDLKGLARALVSDATGGPTEGGSTIAEEFVKNVEQEENHRTVLEKVREAGLAFQLVHRWKRSKLLTQYLNIIYFGNGAYGIEAAARIYFGKTLGYDAANPSAGRCGTPTVARPHLSSCASLLRPNQAALLAVMVANPTEFDPVLHPSQARQRRNQVALRNMFVQHYITRGQYEQAITQPLPTQTGIQQASEPAAAPYFTSWVRPQIISALEREGVRPKDAPYQAYYGGLKIKLTLNLQMQQAAQDAISKEFPGPDGPTASLVSIDNQTGEVRAMVSGDGNYQADPFNLAALGYRQPGSSFKIFTLVQALESGAYGPGSIVDSAPQDIAYQATNGRTGHFVVHNDGNAYSGPITLSEATAISDNTVFAQVGMHLGTASIARQAHLLGIRSPVSTNPAMIIGGLKQGVSPLDMAHAYETLATGGSRVYNPVLGDSDEGAIGIHSIDDCAACDTHNLTNRPTLKRVVPSDVAATIHEMLAGVVSTGTGTAAAIPGVEVVGKTGTTTNYVDAWFCGWTPQLTTCVWVGYPDSGKPMLTNWNGQPVSGGTYPALIWHNYTASALSILARQGTSSSEASTTPLDAITGAGTVPESTVSATTGDATTGSASAGVTGTGATGAPSTSAATAGGTGATAGTTNPGAAPDGPATTGAPAPAATTPAAAAPSTPETGGASSSPPSGAGEGTSGGAGLGGG